MIVKKFPKTSILLMLLLALTAYSYSWTYTPHGRMDYLAAVSLHVLSFEINYQPDPELDFTFPLPANLLFAISAGLPGKEMQKTQDISIPSGDTTIAARIYWPHIIEGAEKPLPITIYFHGGGFVVGDIDIFDNMARSLAHATESILVSVDYRLAPRHPYPAAVDDAYAALNWVAENAASLGGDPSAIAVAGDSAGGNLATVTTIKARNEKGPAIAAQLLFYPGADLKRTDYPSVEKFIDGYGLSTESIRHFREAYFGHVDDLTDPYISPYHASTLENLPPALIVTAGFDPLTDGAHAYAERLKASGVTTVVKHYPEMYHGFMGIKLFADQRDALVETGKFLKRILAEG